MADKVTPAVKAVPKADGFKMSPSYETITTPPDVAGKCWSKGNEPSKIFSKK